MALTDENGVNTTMLVSPAGGVPMYGGYGNGGFGGFGGFDIGWLLLFMLLGNGGWGMGGFGGMMGGGFGGMFEFPWLLSGQAGINANTNNGFQNALLNDNITSVRDSIANLATELCRCCSDMRYDMANGLNGVNQNVSNGFANTNLAMCQGFNGVNNTIFGAQTAISQQMTANEIANLNRSFAEQTANAQGFNGVNAGVADLRYTVATEACADRAAVGDALQNVTMQNMGNTNLIVTAIRDGIQTIKDDLCQDRLDAERRENQNLRTQLNMATLAASQTAQTARLERNNNEAVDSLYNRLATCPVGTMPVYGNQPIFTCPNNNNNGCGCGCGGNF